MGKKILEIAKYISAITVIGLAAIFMNGMKDSGDDNHGEVMEAINKVDAKVDSNTENLNEYKKTTNTHRVYKAEQNKKLIEKFDILQRNQKAIINTSSEQNEILEEIKNQQLINGVADIEPITPIEPDKLTLNK